MNSDEIRHYFHRDKSGNVHVDTMINGERWQHHVHSSAAFVHWYELMATSTLIGLEEEECRCDLVAGQVLEHDGRIWNHPQFL